MQICDKCQSRLPDHVLYCLDCGSRLDDEEATVIRPPNSATVAVVEMPPGFPALKIAFAVIGLVGMAFP